jgi:hypothetical protein
MSEVKLKYQELKIVMFDITSEDPSAKKPNFNGHIKKLDDTEICDLLLWQKITDGTLNIFGFLKFKEGETITDFKTKIKVHLFDPTRPDKLPVIMATILMDDNKFYPLALWKNSYEKDGIIKKYYSGKINGTESAIKELI